jgi:hypothetical protein
MEDVLMAVAVFSGIALVFKVIADATIRHKLINKGAVDENIKHLFTRHSSEYMLSNLKWGMVLIGLGLAMVVPQFLPYYVRTDTMIGLMFLFAGLGFFLYYFIAKGATKNQQKPTHEA